MTTRIFTDQLDREISLNFPPKRIISIVPSQTELLFDLDLDEELTAVTIFCIHPDGKTKSRTKIGGTKKLRIEKILSLKPDLVIANLEENEKAQVEELAEHVPVWISDINTMEDAYDMMATVGSMVDRQEKSDRLINSIQEAFEGYKGHTRTLRTAYFIWRNPMMTVGGDTFINTILKRFGFENVFSNLDRYPEITPEKLAEADPELILLSSEPFPFAEKHLAEFKSICPNAKVELVDGEMFSWYGSRLLQVPDYQRALSERLMGV